jgi:MFS transporter, DHA3 family, macrolide efflux protein
MKQSMKTFLIVWFGQLMSSLGSGMTAFAMGILVFQKNQSATEFAMVMLCLFVPSILLRPLGGIIADRFDRKILIVLGDLGSALGVSFILFSVLREGIVLWKIYLGILINSSSTALQNPAYKAIISDFVSKDEYSKVSGLVQLASSAQHLFSPMLAGLILSFSNIQTILLIDISTFFLAVLAAIALKNVKRKNVIAEKFTFSQDVIGGWNSLKKEKAIFALIISLSLVTFFVGFLQTLFAPMMLSFTNTKTLGIVQSVSASGMLVSSIFLGLISYKKNLRKTFYVSLFAGGIFMGLMGVSRNIFLITGFFFLFFAFLPFINTSAEVMIRKTIKSELQGRTWGFIGFISQLGYVLAYLSAGVLADRIFNPLLSRGGKLADSIGLIIGVGEGRGIGFMLILSGLLLTGTSNFLVFNKNFKKLNVN